MGKYYVDTSIWRDYAENRTDKFRPLGEWALNFFNMVKENKEIVFYSDMIEEELGREYSFNEINELFSIFDKTESLKKLNVTPEQVKEGYKLCKERKVPFGDAINAIIARDNYAIIVARDHHFEELQDVAESKKPEELI